jgi:hypothetical protein
MYQIQEKKTIILKINNKNNIIMGHMTDPRAKALHSDEKYDAKEAYNKDLKPSARLHYLENNIHDHGSPGKMLSTGKVKFPVHHRGGKELGSAELKYMPIMDHGAATYQIEEKGSAAYKYPGAPTHKQGYNARLDDALGSKHGHSNNQSLTDRRHESEGMEDYYGKNKFTGDSKMS